MFSGEIPWTEAPGEPQSIGLDTSEHAWGGKSRLVLFFRVLHTASTSIQSNTCMRVRSLLLPIFGTQATDDSCRGPFFFFFFFCQNCPKLTNPNLLILEQQPKETWTVLTTWLSPSKLSYCPYPLGNFFIHLSLAAALLFGYVETNYKWNVRHSFLTFAILHFSRPLLFLLYQFKKFHLKKSYTVGCLLSAKILMVRKMIQYLPSWIFGSVEKALFIKWLYKNVTVRKTANGYFKLFV